ncbi:MAG TPA: hypothetical protein PLL64_07590 [Rhodothermales bacterium]|nr:hypothetical protein [Bacteroidota bacterium]HRK74121.1 hypothetical protein [Rhodothermales bacterium]HRR08889.1 hypothetical protein [Rhodothermales bacterium]
MRLISLVPAATDWLIALEAVPNLVGCSSDHTQPEVSSLPIVAPHAEQLLAHQPDLVIAPYDITGVPVLVFAPKTMKQVLDYVLKLGKVSGKLPQALQCVAKSEEHLRHTQLQRGINPKRPHHAPSVALVSSFTPLTYETGWIHDLIEHAGGIPFIQTYGNPLLPDVFLIPINESENTGFVSYSEWLSGQSDLVQQTPPKVFYVSDPLYYQPGPQLYHAIQDLMTKLSLLIIS